MGIVYKMMAVNKNAFKVNGFVV